jgi:hypothetical protein
MKSFRHRARLATAAVLVAGSVACNRENGTVPIADDSGLAGDGSGGSDASLACSPADVDGRVVAAYHSARAVQPLACSTLLIHDYYASCLDPSSTLDGCNQSWGAGEDVDHATCQSCILTLSSASERGPLVDYGTGGDGGAGGTVSVNVAGCVETLDPSQLPCAEAVQQADECQHAACDTVCPVSDLASFAEWQRCIDASALAPGSAECAPYLASAACVNGDDAGPAAACVTGTTFEDEFLAIATVFCAAGAGG